MYFLILTGVKNGRFISQTIGYILHKKKQIFSLKLNFEEKGQLYANFLFDILILERKFFAFECLNLGIYMYFPILTGVENGRFNREKSAKFF